MHEHAIELAARHVESFDEYFAQIPGDRLLAMMVHPLLATRGFADIIKLLDDELNDDGAQLLERAKKLLYDQIVKVARRKLEKERQSEAASANASPGSSEGKCRISLFACF